MSLIGNLFSGLFGKKEADAASLPYANCTTSCPVYPNACKVCGPYKEKLLDLIRDADHLEEYYARYEVVPVSENAGTEPCPYCAGGNPVGALVCEYCGSKLREDSGKIRVNDAKDIPNPLLAAQDLIFERASVIEKLSDGTGSELLDSLTELVSGKSNSLGDKMTEGEIKSTAAAYGVSVGTYLQGLDNGKYLTASKKAEADRIAKQEASAAASAVYVSPIVTTGRRAPASVPRPAKPDKGMRRPVEAGRHPAAHPAEKPRHGSPGGKQRDGKGPGGGKGLGGRGPGAGRR